MSNGEKKNDRGMEDTPKGHIIKQVSTVGKWGLTLMEYIGNEGSSHACYLTFG